MSRTKPIVAITMGDPAGIGPEIALKALQDGHLHTLCSPLIVGDAGIMRDIASRVPSDLELRPVSAVAEATFDPSGIDILDLQNMRLDSLAYGRVSAVAGKAAYEYIERAIQLALSEDVDATVTGPIHKEALNAAGYHYAGHTEIFAALTKSKHSFMMLACGNFRTIHVSTHVPLRKACDLVRKERVLDAIQMADRTLRELGIPAPRIAVAGLNPHAGEGGLFGDEDRDEIQPAVEQAREMGIAAEGPLPPDTVFSKARGGVFDIVVAMYHDQGHIPIKLVGFQLDSDGENWKSVSGVNITLGLPIIRVSVDHGVAFDRAGKGTANPESMVEAIRLASQLARSRLH